MNTASESPLDDSNPPTPTSEWERVVSKKRAIRDLDLRTHTDASHINKAITAVKHASDLVEALMKGHLGSEAVTRAYMQQAIKAHEETNCLTEVHFASAIDKAKELDHHLLNTGHPIGPLHGVPVTLKDQFDVKGYDSTLGYVGRAFKPAKADCVLLSLLRSLGAIPLAKTNLPQSIMWCETDNPLFGLTTNPVDKGYTPGGSTGGEAVLLALQGSLLGWGTDIGGSIRIPSHMMGIYGFKPSSARLPYKGVQVSTDGQEHVPSSVGPMARSLETIHLAMAAVVGAEPWRYDPKCVPISWRDDMYKEMLRRPLVIAVLVDDGVVKPHPPIARAMREAVRLLRAAGHTVVDWDASLHQEAIEIMDAYYTADGGEDIRRAVEAGGEPFIPHVERLLNRGKAVSVYDYWQLNRRKRDVQGAYLAKWREYTPPGTTEKVQVDAIIMPPMPHTAVPHGSCRWVGYTKVWNLLDYPALVIPAGRVSDFASPRAGEDEDADSRERGELDAWNQRLWQERGEEMTALNLPIGIQIVGQRLEEEKVLAVGKVLDDLIRAHSL